MTDDFSHLTKKQLIQLLEAANEAIVTLALEIHVLRKEIEFIEKKHQVKRKNV
jgi:hypothetical protein